MALTAEFGFRLIIRYQWGSRYFKAPTAVDWAITGI